MEELRVLRDAPGPDAQAEVAGAKALLHEVAAGRAPATLRVYRPLGATVAFGRVDTLRPGYAAAVAAARSAGFDVAVRASGGRAVAYDETCLVVDHVAPDEGSPLTSRTRRRFSAFASLYAEALAGLGVDARVGPVPDEYCPGPYSVNAGRRVKLVGTAQRVARGGWLFSSVVIVSGAVRLREVLGPVNAGIVMPFDPCTVGSVSDEVPGTTTADVERVVLEAYAQRYRLRRSTSTV
ncbi:MAG: lipoate--protein ligase family protein [Actinomycetota bacterium]|nr:lipoate--protein ligase family protein [Actinomycetota bacterium]